MAFTYTVTIYEKNLITTVKPDMMAETIKLDESLDSAVITIPRLDRKTPFKRFSRVRLGITGDDDSDYDVDYLIYSTKRELGQKGTAKKYNHTLALIEPIKWLEKFIVGSLTFTQQIDNRDFEYVGGSRYFLSTVLERIRKLTPLTAKEISNQYRLFDYDIDFLAAVADVVSPQLYIEKANLREALITVCKVVNAIPRMYYNGGWKVKGDFINQRLLKFDAETDIIDYIQQNDGENYGQTVETFASNVIPEQESTSVYEATLTEYISYRSDEIIVGESNRKLILNNPFERLVSFKALVTSTTNLIELNLTDYCYPKDVYDTLDLKGAIGTKEYACFWQYKQNYIDGLNSTYGIFGTVMAIENIIKKAAKTQFDINNPNYSNVVFKVEYVAYIDDLRAIQYRKHQQPYELDNNLFDEFSGIIINASERLNDLYDLTENVYGQIQRIGVDTIMTSKKHYTISAYDPDTNPDGIYQIGDYTEDNFYVTKVEKAYFKNHIIARYELSNNWNRISQFIQIDKEFRPYETLTASNSISLKRDVIIPIKHVFVSGLYRDLESSNSTLSSNLLKTFKHDETYTLPYMAMAIRQSKYMSFGSEAVYKPIVLLGEKNTIKFKVDFFNTKLAGKNVSQAGAILADVQKGIYYTDNNGFIEYLKIDFYQNYWEQTMFLNLAVITTTEKMQNLKAISDNLPQIKIEYSPNKLRVVQGGTIKTAYKVATYEDMIASTGIYQSYYYIMGGTLESRLYYYGDGGYVLAQPDGFVTHIERAIDYSLPIYEILKDGGEALGLNLILPYRVEKGYENNIILGDMLVKDSSLLKPRATAKNIYLQTRTTRFEEFETSNIGINDNLTLLPTEFVLTNQIIIPATIIAYDHFAITDIDGNVYLLVNQRNLDGTLTDMATIYFHLLDIEDFIEPRLTVYDLNIEIETAESDRLTATLVFQENAILDIAMRENDNLAMTMIHQENVILSAQMRETDKATATFAYLENTTTPDVDFVSWTETGALDTFLFYITNDDDQYVEIFADADSSPSTSRGIVAPGSSVNVSLMSNQASITCYAKAKAVTKNNSAINSAVGTVS